MFIKVERTAYPPENRPVMVWDGQCGFCKYWTTRWRKITGDKVIYKPYQQVGDDFKDIDTLHFKQASRLIETDGQVYSGPRSAYRTLTYGSKWSFLDRWYASKPWFARLSDGLYNGVARNRNWLFKLTKLMYGSNPEDVKPFWVIYLGILAYLVYVAIK